MSNPLMNFVLDRSNELQQEKAAQDGLLRSGEMLNMSLDDLEHLEHVVQNMDMDKVSHVIPMTPEPHHVLSGTYDEGLTREEADLLNKVAHTDHLARQIARTGVGWELLEQALKGNA